MKLVLVTAVLILVQVYQSSCQAPPRLQIPGAFAVPAGGGGGPPQQHTPPRRIPVRAQQPQHQQQLYREDIPVPVRVRRPQQNHLPTLLREQPQQQEVRPVVEEREEPERPVPQHVLRLDAEVARLNAAHEERERQREEQFSEVTQTERPVQFSPQPVVFRPAPKAVPQQDDFRFRQQNVQNFREVPRPIPIQPQQVRQRVVPQQVREPAPVRKAPQPQPQPQQAFRVRPAQAAPIARRPIADDEEEEDRRRKPTAQILRKYREDNPDGSITWGYENDDGSFKEENIGNDCITRGKYGYVDPDGVRREFNYETGNKCDKREEEELPEEDLIQPYIQQAKRPHPLRI